MEESLDLFSIIKSKMNTDDIDIVSYSPLTLAYIGDVVYEIVIRTIVVSKGNRQVNKLHKTTSSLVKASAQSDMIKSLLDDLSEEEMSVYKRGRNAKSVSTPKNATKIDYRTATGFEALMGYLYLTKQSDRMMDLIKTGLENISK